MRARLVVHAAKIPEAAQRLNPGARRVKGVEMVNACNDRTWVRVPLETPPSRIQRCDTCALIVEANRSRRSDEGASI